MNGDNSFNKGIKTVSVVTISKNITLSDDLPLSILHKSTAGRYWPVRVADGPITARYRFIKNASWTETSGYNFLFDVMQLGTRSLRSPDKVTL